VEIKQTSLPGVFLVEPRVFSDSRGYFYEVYRDEEFSRDLARMVQVNVSRSRKGVLRGLHFQRHQPQAKLVSVIRGAVYDVAVDLRLDSPTFRRWYSVELNDENHRALYIPMGFAHGYFTLSAEVDLMYQCSDYYHPASEVGIVWNDPDIDIVWPAADPILSTKDAANRSLADLETANQLPSLMPAAKP
jgi:dTDP-4-dehydrorhamnose 3,5-epimerase